MRAKPLFQAAKPWQKHWQARVFAAVAANEGGFPAMRVMSKFIVPRSIVMGLSLLATAGCASFLGGDLVREGEPVGQVVLVNDSGIDINVVTISRCNAMSHGLNVLNGGDRIASGTSRSWRVNAGCWDIGAGRTGTCTSAGCAWNEGYIRVQVPAEGSKTARFTTNRPS